MQFENSAKMGPEKRNYTGPGAYIALRISVGGYCCCGHDRHRIDHMTVIREIEPATSLPHPQGAFRRRLQRVGVAWSHNPLTPA